MIEPCEVYKRFGADPAQDGEIQFRGVANGPYERSGDRCDIVIYDRSIHNWREPTGDERVQFESNVIHEQHGLDTGPHGVLS